MRKYELAVMLKACALFREGEEERKWLLENGYRELVEFHDALDRSENSFSWLLKNDFRELAALVDALQGDEKAKLFLVKDKQKELVVFIDAAAGNKSAVEWLARFNYKEWLMLAREIYLWNKKNEPKGIWSILNLGNPFR